QQQRDREIERYVDPVRRPHDRDIAAVEAQQEREPDRGRNDEDEADDPSHCRDSRAARAARTAPRLSFTEGASAAVRARESCSSWTRARSTAGALRSK